MDPYGPYTVIAKVRIADGPLEDFVVVSVLLQKQANLPWAHRQF